MKVGLFPEAKRRIGRWLGPSKAIVSDLVFKVMTASGEVIHTSAVEPVTQADLDTSSVQLLIKEYDRAIHNIMPFVNIDVEKLFGMDKERGLVEIDEPMRNVVPNFPPNAASHADEVN